jgi:ATP phosphoribosyltransferase
VPKNSGLSKFRELALDSINANKQNLLEVRGEDVPFWVERLLKEKKQAIGLTGQDLFKEYCLSTYESNLEVIKILEWDDPVALFRKPVLCLLGPVNRDLDTIPKKQRICISFKYKLLAKKYLNFLETKGFVFEKFYVNGSVESSFSAGIADLVIDIVYTGTSMKSLGLKVYDKIFYSNFVIIGGKNGKY